MYHATYSIIEDNNALLLASCLAWFCSNVAAHMSLALQ